MLTQSTTTSASIGDSGLKPMDYATLLGQFGEKYRQSVERQVAAYEAKLGRPAADRWRRLACFLMTLAPQPPKLTGMHTMQFFIPDGKYRKQVFALHAAGDGALAVYAPDVLQQAQRKGMLGKAIIMQTGNIYPLPNSSDTVVIESLDGKTGNPSPFYKDMTGWNRKAICINVPNSASEAQVEVTERLVHAGGQ